MSLPLIMSAIGVAMAILLTRVLLARRRTASLDEIVRRRSARAKVSGLGEFVEGSRHISVAIAVSESTFFYENDELEASLPLHFVREVEYDDSLLTGQRVSGGDVLRLRCWAQVFEFIIPAASVAAWRLSLPPHRYSDAAPAH